MLGSLRVEYCIPYLDDLLCYSRSFSDHVKVICKFLQALQHHGLKLRVEKCEMFQEVAHYVGRLDSAEGVQIDPENLEAVMALKTKTPQTVGDLRRILGFLSYYRSYIQDFAKIAKPLYELLQVKSSMPNPFHVTASQRVHNSRPKHPSYGRPITKVPWKGLSVC